MNITLLAFLLVVVMTLDSAAKSDKDKDIKIIEECSAANELTVQQLNGLGDLDASNLPSNVKCHIKCVYEARGVIVESVLNSDVLMRNGGFDGKLLDSCEAVIRPIDDCEEAWKVTNEVYYCNSATFYDLTKFGL